MGGRRKPKVLYNNVIWVKLYSETVSKENAKAIFDGLIL